jgi:hypothetical protein
LVLIIIMNITNVIDSNDIVWLLFVGLQQLTELGTTQTEFEEISGLTISFQQKLYYASFIHWPNHSSKERYLIYIHWTFLFLLSQFECMERLAETSGLSIEQVSNSHSLTHIIKTLKGNNF